MFIIRKGDRYLKGRDYCTGFPSRNTWTTDPKEAWKFAIDDGHAVWVARQTRGKLIPFTD